MIEILKALSEIPVACGLEDGIISYIKKEYSHLEAAYDGMGNLILERRCGKENASKVMLSVGCDDCGFIVNYIEESGYLRLTPLGAVSAYSAACTEVTIGDGVHGVIAVEAGAELKDSDTSRLYADIGAASREEAERAVVLGDICAPIPRLRELCGGKIGGLGLSSRLGAAIALEAIDKATLSDIDLYICLAVQTRLRARGGQTAAFEVEPDYCIGIEAVESLDTVGASKRGEAVLGDGAVILAKAGDYCANPELRKALEDTARGGNIPFKTCVYSEKATLASQIAKSGKGVPCAVVGVPVRNIGSGAEVLCVSDAENAAALILEALKSMNK